MTDHTAITDRDIRYENNRILLSIALQESVLDIDSDLSALQAAITFLHQTSEELRTMTLGSFGIYPISLVSLSSEQVCIFVDGPNFQKSKTQSAGVYFWKDERFELESLFLEAIQGAPPS
jgi:hypothetical protein